MSLFTHAQYRVDYVLSLDPATGLPGSGGLNSPNPANRVVAFLWHQGEADFTVPFPLSSWSSCLESLIVAWRGRYGGNVPFVAGTYAFSQQGWMAASWTDFLRYNFGRGMYGGFDSGYYASLTQSTMPILNLPSLGLADSYYAAPPGSGSLVPSIVPFDPATTQHFSVLGYQVCEKLGLFVFFFHPS